MTQNVESGLGTAFRDVDAVEAQPRQRRTSLGPSSGSGTNRSARDIERRRLIDGQQRVTTFHCCWMRSTRGIARAGQRSAARRLAKYVLNDEGHPVEDSPEQRFNVATRGDWEAFRHAMDNGLANSKFEDSLSASPSSSSRIKSDNGLRMDNSSEEAWRGSLRQRSSIMSELVVIDLGIGRWQYHFQTLKPGGPSSNSRLIEFCLIAADLVNDGKGQANVGLALTLQRDAVRQGRLFRPSVSTCS